MVLVVATYLITLVIGGVSYFMFSDAVLDALLSLFLADVIMTVLVFIVSAIINNSSVYDPFWSIIPVFIVLVWIYDTDFVNLFSLVALAGVLIWAVRLTRNWAIDFKGFSHEDFRYVDFRNQFKKLYWIISFLGIHLFPTVIVFASIGPLLYVFNNGVNHEAFIYLGFIIMVAGALISFIADAQLRAHKKQGIKKSIRTGLWNHSRHPNYFGEVFFWMGVFVTSLATEFVVINGLGFVGMLILFNLYSVPKMESKLLKNKDDYQSVVDNVPRFFLFPNSKIESEQKEKEA